MRHLWWLIPFVAALAAFRVWWAGPADVGVLLILVCGLAGLAYLVVRTRQPMPSQEDDRDKRQGDAERQVPPRS
jgi:membrane protein implicated in regulation of membrane protease activity